MFPQKTLGVVEVHPMLVRLTIGSRHIMLYILNKLKGIYGKRYI